MYQVSNLGNVRKTKNKRILKPFDTGRGYLNVKLSKNNIAKTVSVHRLVAKAFIPNLNNLEQVNHKDENKKNNNVNNLEWCTHKYNQNYGTRKIIVAKKKFKEVNQYNLDGSFIRSWISITETSRQLKIKDSNIIAVCKGKRKSAGGYIWKYQ